MPLLTPGDSVPWFTGRTAHKPHYVFSSIAERYIVLSFVGSTSAPQCQAFLQALNQERALFDDNQKIFFAVTVDPKDEQQEIIQPDVGKIDFFYDFDMAISRLYGALSPDENQRYKIFTLVIDHRYKVMKVIPFGQENSHFGQLKEFLTQLPSMSAHTQAPVLIVPGVFEPSFCRELIELYQTRGGQESGFMQDRDGMTVEVISHLKKSREDYMIEERTIQEVIKERIYRRLIPEVEKAFQFKATHLERYLLACYDTQKGGYFHTHRDNTTKGTAHRRFAITLNLNAEEYEGCDLKFPEFGLQTYRAGTGEAIIFSCSLLHAATPITKGQRYAFLSFLYDETGKKIRDANKKFLQKADDPVL